MDPLALVCSVELEAEPLLKRIGEVEEVRVASLRAHRGRLGAEEAIVVVCGMGKTNAAHGLTALLGTVRVRGVVGFGVAGAYPGQGLAVGDVAFASSQHYADEGVETADGWLTCEGIGIPLLDTGTTRYFNDFPIDSEGLASIASAIGPLRAGPFVTVSCCSGTRERGIRLRDRFDALCETMEGAAYAHMAATYRLPYLEVRGISNLVEDRNLSAWRLVEAADAAADMLRHVSAHWRPRSVATLVSGS